MMLAFARAGVPPSEVREMSVRDAAAMYDLLTAQAQAAWEDSKRG